MPARRPLPEPSQGRDRPATTISPSILSSDFARLADSTLPLLQQGADWLHVDVMDGHFVDNLTIGPPVVTSLRKHSEEAFLDCHLMVSEPDKWVQDMAKAGANMYTFHLECPCFEQPSEPRRTEAVAKLAAAVREAGMHAGVALRPSTPVEAVMPYLEAGDFDLALCLSVEPGFGGQKFQPEAMTKVRKLRDAFPALQLEVDGGISPSTIDQAAQAGANVVVAGSAIFGAEDPAQVMRTLRESVDAAATSAASSDRARFAGA